MHIKVEPNDTAKNLPDFHDTCSKESSKSSIHVILMQERKFVSRGINAWCLTFCQAQAMLIHFRILAQILKFIRCFKAMVSWFPWWQSDRCADLGADGMIKLHFYLFFLDSYRPADSIINQDTTAFVHQVQTLHESFENKPKIFSFFSLFLLASFPFSFFFPLTTDWKSYGWEKNCHFLNFILFSTDRLFERGSWKICHPGNQPTMA